MRQSLAQQSYNGYIFVTSKSFCIKVQQHGVYSLLFFLKAQTGAELFFRSWIAASNAPSTKLLLTWEEVEFFFFTFVVGLRRIVTIGKELTIERSVDCIIRFGLLAVSLIR
jgi:hypothetical protein